MKTAIIYYSAHHHNTKKLLEAIDGEGVDLLAAEEGLQADLAEYDLIGLASGIYFSRFNDKVLDCAKRLLPPGKKVFLIYTYGIKMKNYAADAERLIAEKGCRLAGKFGCRGYDTYGFWGKIGGIAKGRPNDRDVANVKRFYQNIRR